MKTSLFLILVLVTILFTNRGVHATRGPFTPTSLLQADHPSTTMHAAAGGRKLLECAMPCPNEIIPDGVCTVYDDQGSSWDDVGCCLSCCSAKYYGTLCAE
ncbi:hypothetical protein Mapa_013440 [Marchantia paleacea]|nr:hypothetical protein Mapa_013440 [Marchantia paleacea]